MAVRVELVRDWFRPEQRDLSLLEPGRPLREALPQDWDPALVAVSVDGSMTGPEALDRVPREGQRIVAVLTPGDPVSFGLTLAASLLLSFIVNKFFAPPLEPREHNDERSNTYGWGPIKTEYNPYGLPWPKQYGRHRVGGNVIKRYVEEGNDNRQFLYLLITYGTGPYKSIGGVEIDADGLAGETLPEGLLINGSPATNYGDVRAAVRLGRSIQEPIPWFDRDRTQYDPDLLLDQVALGAGSPVTDWDAYGVQFFTPIEGSSIRVGVGFPGGLYSIDGGGNYQPQTAQFQIRHRAVDDAQQPIGPWVLYIGPGGSGNVTVTREIPGEFVTDVAEVPLWEPGTYQAPMVLTKSQTNGTSQWAATASPGIAGATDWVAGNDVEKMTVVFRGTPRSTGDHPLFGWTNWNGLYGGGSMNLAGWFIGFVDEDGGTGMRVRVYWGNGGGTTANVHWSTIATQPLPGLVDPGELVQVVVTYERLSGTQFRIRCWLNNSLEIDHTSTVRMVAPSAAMSIARANGNDTDFGHLELDELSVHHRAWTSADVIEAHNSGFWYYLDPARHAKMRAQWIFEAGSFLVDQSNYGHTAVWTPSTPTQAAGWVLTQPSGEPYYGKVELQVQRVNNVAESETVRDEARLARLQVIRPVAVRYNRRALLALRIEATDRLSGSEPNVTVVVEGRNDLPIWDGVNPSQPQLTKGYSTSPAWQLAHHCLDKRNGGGLFYDSTAALDWAEIGAWAAWCAERVYDQKGKLGAVEIAYDAPDADFPNGAFRIAFGAAVVPHFVVGKFVRVADPVDVEYPEGEFEIRKAASVGSQFTIWMDWAGSAPGDTSHTGADQAIVSGREERIETAFVFGDRGLGFWESVKMMCSAGRATPVPIGERLGVIFQGAGRESRGMFSPVNMIAGSFEMGAVRVEEQYNRAIGEIQDEDSGYERNPIARVHKSLREGSAIGPYRTQGFDLRGCTRRSQANRELEFMLNVSQGRTLRLAFDSILDAAFMRPGELFYAYAPVPEWAYYGECGAASSTLGVQVDVPVSLEDGVDYYAIVRRSATDATSVVPLESGQDGDWPAGTIFALAEALSFAPEEKDLWAIGELGSIERLFMVSGHSLSLSTMKVGVDALEWSDDLLPDEEDGFEALAPETLVVEGGGGAGSRGEAAAALPAPGADVGRVVLAEEAGRNATTGALELAVVASWRPRPGGGVRETAVYAAPAGGVPELVALVGPTDGRARLWRPGMASGSSWTVFVQHRAPDGSATPVRSCPQAAITLRGWFRAPEPVTALTAVEAGRGVTYVVDLPEGLRGLPVEIVRGGDWIGQPLGRIPAGGTTLGPTDDWDDLSDVPIYARAVLPNGVPGERIALPLKPVPPGWTSDIAVACHLDWDDPGGLGAPTTEDLEEGPSGELRFVPASSATEGVYETPVIDLGAVPGATDRHVAWGVNGTQAHPVTEASLGEAQPMGRFLSWSPEGPSNPLDPVYAGVTTILEWQHGTGASPDSGWKAFRVGTSYFRSCRFRLRIQRPDDSWQIAVLAAEVSIMSRPLV